MVPEYLPKETPKGFSALLSAKALNMVAQGLLGIFLPIFLYDLFDANMFPVLLWYALGSILTMALLPIGVHLLSRIGFKRSLQISSLIGLVYYALYYYIDIFESAYVTMILITATLAVWRLFYWLPYHITFTELSASSSRARQVSIVRVLREIGTATMPVVAGLVITVYSYDHLFIVAMILFAVSIFPYAKIPPSSEKYEWAYVETFRNLFSRQNRWIVVPFTALGAENVAGIIIWPIFIYQILQGNYLEVGALTTVIVLITMIAQLLVGKYLDDSHRSMLILKYGSTLNSLGWIVKAFVLTSVHIFITGVYHSFVKVFTMTPLDTLMYEIGADQGHYIDEYTVLHELALHLGRLLMLGAVALLLLFVSIQWTFIIAAVASLTFNLISAGKISVPKTG